MAIKAGLEHLKDPIVLTELLTSALPAFAAMAERFRQRRDPTLRGLTNDRIRQYQGMRANAGDAATGYGGAFGVDGEGKPLSLAGGMVKYGVGQMGGSNAGFQQQQSGRNTLLANSSAASRMPGGMNMDLGPMPAFDAGAVQGVDPGSVGAPVDVPYLKDPRFMPKYAVGVTSVPETGPAILHKGEAVIPAQMNPAAGTSPRPMLPQARQTLGVGGGGARMAQMNQPSLPKLNVNLQPMQVGLNAGVQGQIINRAQEGNDLGAAAAARGIRDGAGSVYSGQANEDQFANELARRSANMGVVRDVGIAAAERQFGDQLAMNQLELARGSAAADVDIAAGNLDLQRGLGYGDLDLRRDSLDADTRLRGRGMDIERELGLGGLANDRTQIGNQFVLGRGGLENDRARIGNDYRLGSEANRNTARGIANDYDIAGRRVGLDTELGRGQLANDRFGLDTDRTRVGYDYDLGLRDNALGNREVGLRENQWQDQFARDVYNDNTGDQRWWTERNDRLMQQLFDNGMDLEQLVALFGDSAGGLASQMA